LDRYILFHYISIFLKQKIESSRQQSLLMLQWRGEMPFFVSKTSVEF